MINAIYLRNFKIFLKIKNWTLHDNNMTCCFSSKKLEITSCVKKLDVMYHVIL